MNLSRGPAIAFFGLIFLGIVTYYLIHFGFYPIAIVNGHFLSEEHFSETQDFVLSYYEKARVTYNLSGVQPDDPLYGVEVARATLEKLIDQHFMHARLKSMLGGELNAIVDQKLENVKTTGSDFAKAVETIYGLSVDQFRDEVLVPQAEEEILRGRLLALHEDFDAWLLSARRGSRVIILHPNLTWGGEGVVLRK